MWVGTRLPTLGPQQWRNKPRSGGCRLGGLCPQPRPTGCGCGLLLLLCGRRAAPSPPRRPGPCATVMSSRVLSRFSHVLSLCSPVSLIMFSHHVLPYSLIVFSHRFSRVLSWRSLMVFSHILSRFSRVLSWCPPVFFRVLSSFLPCSLMVFFHVLLCSLMMFSCVLSRCSLVFSHGVILCSLIVSPVFAHRVSRVLSWCSPVFFRVLS